jgi:hypothetical protein
MKMQPRDFDRDFDYTTSGRITIGFIQCSTYSEDKGFMDWVGTIDLHSSTDASYYAPTFIVDFDLLEYHTLELYICNKQKLRKEICDGARAYWHKQFHRKYYQPTLAQWIQRELELPGEVAWTIALFV